MDGRGPRAARPDGRIAPQAADVLLEALDGDTPVPFLTEHHVGSGRLLVLNLHMFTQEDFDAVNEVLLSPRNLGLLDIPEAWAAVLRDRFGGGGERLVSAPTRVTIQPLGESGWFIQNYNTTPATVRLDVSGLPAGSLRDGFTGAVIEAPGDVIERTMPARSRCGWRDERPKEMSLIWQRYDCIRRRDRRAGGCPSTASMVAWPAAARRRTSNRALERVERQSASGSRSL